MIRLNKFNQAYDTTVFPKNMSEPSFMPGPLLDLLTRRSRKIELVDQCRGSRKEPQPLPKLTAVTKDNGCGDSAGKI